MNHEQAKKILVVDDEPFVCELLSRWLTVDGDEFTVAFSGEEALRASSHFIHRPSPNILSISPR